MVLTILFGYIDVSSMTLVIQMLAGAVIGSGIAVKLYWEQIKLKFNKK
jgi:hypothetical protein